jgi:flagellar motor switch protein FliN/FliY
LKSAGAAAPQTPPPKSPASTPAAGPAGGTLDATEIDNLLKQSSPAPAQPQGRSAASPRPEKSTTSTEKLLDQAEADLAKAIAPSLEARRGIPSELGAPSSYAFAPFEERAAGTAGTVGLPALQDVELDLRIELGRTELLIDEVLKLKEGSVVPLDKLAGDPVDILVNGRLVARGEVLVLNDNFCVRVAEILTPDF